MLRGGCLCGAIRYEIDGALGAMTHCHCAMCRKAHGAAFATYASVLLRDFRFDRGEDQRERYRSSPEVDRAFCKRCGSNLLFLYRPDPERVEVAVGTLDGDPGRRPEAHIFTASKAPWFELRDDLPQHSGDLPND